MVSKNLGHRKIRYGMGSVVKLQQLEREVRGLRKEYIGERNPVKKKQALLKYNIKSKELARWYDASRKFDVRWRKQHGISNNSREADLRV